MEIFSTWIDRTHELLTADSYLAWFAIGAFALVATVIVKLTLQVLSKILRKLSDRTESIWDDVAVGIIEEIQAWVLFTVSFYLTAQSFRPVEVERKLMLIALVVALTFQVAKAGFSVIRNWRSSVIDKKIQQDPSSTASLGLLYTAIQAVYLTVIILVGLSTVGVDISALVAGLGVGGIAIALAAQNILSDLLASLSIVLDKPFVVGDYIVSGGERGTVEHIGIKTTRLRSLSGEQIVLSNKFLIESQIQNFKRMLQRRVVISFGVIYATKADVLEKIPTWAQKFVEADPMLKFDRCHFAEFGASSLDFELVFYVMDPEYPVYMSKKEKILLDIFKKFAAEGVEFAFPTQSIYVERLPSPEVPK
jgi:small-conductance mechanosensitive channel